MLNSPKSSKLDSMLISLTEIHKRDNNHDCINFCTIAMSPGNYYDVLGRKKIVHVGLACAHLNPESHQFPHT